jgi:light-regulated signal transduction histidine kinase (bacteriophytochrome)
MTRPIELHYKQALSGFVANGDEAGLELAYEIGRIALASGISLSQVGELHYTAHSTIAPEASDTGVRQRAEQFFLEISTVYDMALRGHRETIERLRVEIEERGRVEAELRKTATELERERDRLEHRVRERTHALMMQAEKLERSNQELKRRNQELDEFAYIASHDLKEPLRAISNHASFLLEDCGARLDPDGQHRLTRLIKLSERITILIGALFRYSSLGRTQPPVGPVELGEVLADVQANLMDTLQLRNASITTLAPLPRVIGDRTLLAALFQNLVSNGTKYNDAEAKRIEIGRASEAEAGKRDGFVTVYVRDNGIGIAPEFHEEVFRIFKRLNSEKAYGEGTGAGLSFVKKIVEYLGGQIWIDSEPGRGATFYVTLPNAEIANL